MILTKYTIGDVLIVKALRKDKETQRIILEYIENNQFIP